MRPSHSVSIAAFLALSFAAAPSALAQVVARDHGSGTVDLLEFRTGQTLLNDVALLDCRLVGYARKDRLRASYPRPGQVADLPDHILLPGGGSLWRATQGLDELLIQVDPGGDLRVLLRVPAATGGIESRLTVSPSGDAALVAADRAVWRVDLNGGTALSLTGHLGALSASTKSLRLNADAGYFIADDTLFACPAGATGPDMAVAVQIALHAEEEILTELVLATSSAAVLVTLEVEETERRLVAVHGDGTTEFLTSAPTALPLPGLDEDLGPFIAISPDGQRAAWRTEGASEELYLTCLGGGYSHHVTTLPEYPVYLDNIGVLAFGTTNRLCFFAGDRVISGLTGAEIMGAADMYAVTVDPWCRLSSRNVSGTSGGFTPPFTLIGQMTLEATVLDPMGERFIVEQEPEDGPEHISTFPIEALPGQSGYGSSNILMQHDDFEYFAAGSAVLVVTERDHGSDEVVELSLIPAHDGTSAQPISLGSWHESTRVQQVTHHGSNACVRLLVQGEPRTFWLDVTAGRLLPVLPMTIGHPLELSSPLTFDHQGQLVLGATRHNGRSTWLRVAAPGSARAHRVGAGHGFLLPY